MDDQNDCGYWRGRRVLVTGATGLIGAWLVARLARHGALVVGTVSGPPHVAETFPAARRVRFLEGDICDPAFAKQCLNASKAETVIHLAGRATTQMALADPADTFDVNVRGTWNLLEACRAHKIPPTVVIAASERSNSVGSVDTATRSQGETPTSLHPYDVSKYCGELLARSFASTFGMTVALARCCNVYGGGDRNFSRLVPGTIRSALRGEPPVIRSSGRARKRLLHADDASRGMMAIVEYLGRTPSGGQAFDLSGDEDVSVTEVVTRILSIMESPLKPVVLSRGACEVTTRRAPDVSSTRGTLGWKPRVTLRAGLAATIAWYRDHDGAEERSPAGKRVAPAWATVSHLPTAGTARLGRSEGVGR